MKRYNLILLIMIFFTCHSNAIAGSGVVVKNNGTVEFFGYKLDVKNIVKISSPAKESDTPIYYKKNKNGKYVLVQLFDGEESKFWLYNTILKDKPKKIKIDTGNNIEVVWHNNHIFEISWGGMGYSMSAFFNTKVDSKKIISDLLAYDVINDIYVSFYRDGVVAGRIKDANYNDKKINLELKYESISEAIFAIDKVDILIGRVIVKYVSSNGNIREQLIEVD